MTDLKQLSREREKKRLSYFLGEPCLSLFTQPGVSEVSVNDDGKVFVSRSGCLDMEYVGEMPLSNVEAFIYCVASTLGKVIDRDTDPTLSGELPAYEPWRGARMQATLPPASRAASFTVRVHSKKIYTLQDYLDAEILTKSQFDALRNAAARRESILVGGGTESGKSTLLNAIISEVAERKPTTRAVIIEQAREIQSKLSNTKQLKTSGNKSILDLARDAMRERPDLIVIGEMRGAEASVFIQTLSSGHSGGMSTLHANSLRGCMNVLERYIRQGGHEPIREQIAEVINWVIYIRKKDGTKAGRVVEELARVTGLDDRGHYKLEEVK